MSMVSYLCVFNVRLVTLQYMVWFHRPVETGGLLCELKLDFREF